MQISATVKPRKFGRKPAKILLPAVHFHRPCFSCVKCEWCLFLSSSLMNLWPPAISRAARCQCVPSLNYFTLLLRMLRSYFVITSPWLFLCVNFTLDRLYFCSFLSSLCQNNKEASQWINRKVVVLQSQWIKLLCSLCCDSSPPQFQIFATEFTEKLLERAGFFIQKNLYYRLEARSEYRAFTQFICKVKSRTNSN